MWQSRRKGANFTIPRQELLLRGLLGAAGGGGGTTARGELTGLLPSSALRFPVVFPPQRVIIPTGCREPRSVLFSNPGVIAA